jgi:holin-like protein
MLASLAILFAAQLIGEALRQALHLPLPGPVIGMFLLAAGLVVRDRLHGAESEAAPSALTRTANTLIANMGLLFVPAGVGVMAEMGVLRQEWLPILAGLMVSTVLGVVVTGLVMHHVSRRAEPGR